MELTEKILKSFKISKPQRKFLVAVFTAILTARGKINCRNLSRYSDVSEETYSRQFAKPFAFVAFNRSVIDEGLGRESDRIIVIDASFVSKSGKKTYGLDSFWNGCHRRSEKGLEVSSVAIVDILKNTGFTLSVRQTDKGEEPQASDARPKEEVTKPKEKNKATSKKCTKKKGKAKSKKKRSKQAEDDETLLDQYLQHLIDVQPSLLEPEKYVVGDGYFSKKKFVNGVCELDLHQIGKLRGDANMRFLYTGPKREHGSGRQKTYDGKVNWQDLSRFSYVETQDGIAIYTLILNHVSLKRNLKIVVLVDERNKDKKKYTILFSTDTELDAKTLVRYYKARFQIEFIFRDAKQFTGLPVCLLACLRATHRQARCAQASVHRLSACGHAQAGTGRCDCQARDQARLDFHFNASLTTLNLAKLEHLQAYADTEPGTFSMASIKACYFNTFFLQHIFSMLDLDLNLMKKSSQYQRLRDYGKIAA